MSTRESKQTKETLKENKNNFKKLENNLDSLRAEFQKKLMKQISSLDEKQKKEAQKMKARKKALALKGKIYGAYAEEGERQSLQVPVDGEVKEGTMVFMKSCSVCHSLEGVDHKAMKGPSLGLIYNRRAGANLNFDQYSDSLLKSTIFWSPLNLYRFMANPGSIIPKTNCGLTRHPIRSEQDRADLIALFRQFTTEMAFNVRLKQIEKQGLTAFQTQLYAQKEESKRGQARDKREKWLDQKI